MFYSVLLCSALYTHKLMMKGTMREGRREVGREGGKGEMCADARAIHTRLKLESTVACAL